LSSDVAIRVREATKDYPGGSLTSGGVKDLLLHLPSHLRHRRQRKPFRALDRVSFEVRKGECFGIIGCNGSGKSTTLGLIAGVLRPSSGSVETHGRIAPLLELGAGFHPELSGRENIVLNGVLLGMTRRQVMERLGDIIAFSELSDFMERPLRVYSSGMVARLGFSVAVHLDPEILLIDEVLAVGDEAFMAKCFQKILDFRANGVTMVFVSHNMAAVELVCDRVALLDAGRLVAVDSPKPVIAEYRKSSRAVM